MKGIVRKFTPPFLLNWYHFILAFSAALWYGFPSKKLKVIGVTGTNGKTTTTEMISKILEEAGHKAALMNSIRFKIGQVEEPNMLKMTMPGRFFVQRFLRRAMNEDCQYVVLEITSEGIKQHRHRFIDFEAAVFTNLTPEHIEAHKSFENYKKAKGKLFRKTKNIHIINLDDANADYFLQFSAKKKYTYGLSQGDVSDKDIQFKLNLIGDFNIYNALAATGAAVSQGVSIEKCKEVLEKIEGIPGRMELVISEPFKVFVDYAFTPNALQKVYETLSEKLKTQNPKSKMICVLGAAGGGRDKWKRPVLGGMAAKYCGKIIITNEDPYDENPMEIIEQVARGAERRGEKILERRAAISIALELAEPGDVLIITGKGCEPWICIENGKKIPWDDRQVAREEFEKLRKS